MGDKALCSTYEDYKAYTVLLVEEWYRIEQEIARLTGDLGKIKQEIHEHFSLSQAFMSADERIEIARSWYWESDWSTPMIAEFLGVHTNSVCRTVGPWLTGLRCEECGYEFRWHSREERKTMRGGRERWGCPVCRERKKEQSSKKREEEIRNRTIEIERLQEMNYRLYLQTEHWQEVRKAALKRARYRCQLCSATKRLQVHHNTYENRGDEKPQDVIVLCRDCHEKHHDIGNGYRVPDEYSDIIIG